MTAIMDEKIPPFEQDFDFFRDGYDPVVTGDSTTATQ
jgi:hypothetical protein